MKRNRKQEWKLLQAMLIINPNMTVAQFAYRLKVMREVKKIRGGMYV